MLSNEGLQKVHRRMDNMLGLIHNTWNIDIE